MATSEARGARRQLLLAAIIGDPAREERADRAVWAANASVATALRAHDARAPALKEALRSGEEAALRALWTEEARGLY